MSEGTKRIKWDEETIALHDLDRGTRMKINEPNTPYHYYEPEEDHGSGIPVAMTDVNVQMHNASNPEAPKPRPIFPVSPARSASNGSELKWDELESKLKDQEKRSEWDTDSEGEEKEKVDKEFAKKRKQHYNEYEMMKQWRMQHKDDDDDEEE